MSSVASSGRQGAAQSMYRMEFPQRHDRPPDSRDLAGVPVAPAVGSISTQLALDLTVRSCFLPTPPTLLNCRLACDKRRTELVEPRVVISWGRSAHAYA